MHGYLKMIAICKKACAENRYAWDVDLLPGLQVYGSTRAQICHIAEQVRWLELRRDELPFVLIALTGEDVVDGDLGDTQEMAHARNEELHRMDKYICSGTRCANWNR